MCSQCLAHTWYMVSILSASGQHLVSINSTKHTGVPVRRLFLFLHGKGIDLRESNSQSSFFRYPSNSRTSFVRYTADYLPGIINNRIRLEACDYRGAARIDSGLAQLTTMTGSVRCTLFLLELTTTLLMTALED